MEFNFVSQNIEHCCEIIHNKLYFMTISADKKIKNNHDSIYFCIDNELQYNSYYSDFGPLSISCLYKYYCKLTKYLSNFTTKRIIHYTTPNECKRANAACLIGSYSIISLGFMPRDIFKILTYHLPPYKPFLDASQGDGSGYTIHLSDVLSAVYKAQLFGFFNFEDFDVHEYNHFNMLEHGDLNWLLPRKFLAFIGPMDHGEYYGLEPGVSCHSASYYINYFLDNNVRAVIRLNNKLYDESVFTNAGIQHYDMYFDDGTVPPQQILNQFLRIAENTKGPIAVHCKAGLGRTGSLIGAYIIKHYHMTARETIGWLRLCRPGCVIGQQQGWLERVEKYLWDRGNEYRLENFGQEDKIPHHKYGIYSIRWKKQWRLNNEPKSYKVKYAQMKKLDKKISSNYPRYLTRQNTSPYDHVTKPKIPSKPKPPVFVPSKCVNAHIYSTSTSLNKRRKVLNSPPTIHPKEGIQYTIKDSYLKDLQNLNGNTEKHNLQKSLNQKHQDDMTVLYVNPKKTQETRVLSKEVNAINFRNTNNRAKLSDKKNENKPRVSSAYTDYISSNNTPYNMNNYQRNNRLHQCESVYNTNLQPSINLVQQNIESVTRKIKKLTTTDYLLKTLRDYTLYPTKNQPLAPIPSPINNRTQGDRLNELKQQHAHSNNVVTTPSNYEILLNPKKHRKTQRVAFHPQLITKKAYAY